MACRYTYNGETYEAWEFEDVLLAMPPSEASAFMPDVKSVSDAPFIRSTDAVLNLALKRIITMAVEGGYEKVAFVNGEQSADRYDLSKQVDAVAWQKQPDGSFNIQAIKGEDEVSAQSGMSQASLADAIGKEAAEKIVARSEGASMGTLRGLDLKVGGEGMKTFYDSIVPQAVKKLISKMDGKLETVGITTKNDNPVIQIDEDAWMPRESDLVYRTKEDAEAAAGQRTEQPGFSIAPKMTESVKRGLPRFSDRPEAQNRRYTEDEIQQLISDAWSQLKTDTEYVKLDRAVTASEEAARNRWHAVNDKAVEILMSKPKFAKIASEYDSATVRSLAQVFIEEAQAAVPKSSPSTSDAMRARSEYVDGYFRDVAKIPEPSPFSEEANQQRGYYTGPAFKNWFKRSMVVDKDGNPLVAFHVTTKDFVEFNTNAGVGAEKMGHGAYSGQLGSWFTAPSLYRDNYDAGNAEVAVEGFIQDDGFRSYKDGAVTMPVHLSIQNPMEYSDFESMLEDRDSYKSIAAYKKSLIAQGHDGIVIRNSDTDGNVDRDDWVAFEATQIKSAIGNSGAFDPASPDIRYSDRDPQYSRRTGSGWDEPMPSKWDDLVFKMQDKMVDLKRVVQDITKWTGQLADDINVYLQEELYHGRTAKRVQDFTRLELEPALKALAAHGFQLADLEEYMHARHAKEANRVIARRNPNEPGLQDGGSGMKDADVDAYFANLSQADRAKLDSVAQMFDAIMKQTNQLMVDYELESQDAIDAWDRMFKHYVPLHREDKDGGRGTGQGFSIKGKETKGRTGSTRKVVDIISHIAQARENTVVRGEKNRVSKALVGLVTTHPNQDFWKVGPPETERVYNPKTGVVEDRINPMYKNMPNVVVAKMNRNGKVEEVVVTFNEDNERAVRLAGALKNLDAPRLEGLMGVSAKITRYFASINTQYNPVFGVVNLVRDIQGALINLGTTPLAGMKGRISKDAILALGGIYKDIRATRNGGTASSAWSQLYEQFQEDGGQTGFRDLFATPADRTQMMNEMIDPEAWAKSGIGKFFSADGKLVKPINQIKKGAHLMFDWLSDYNEALENSVRLAAYKAALDKGMSRQQAASLAKNLTVNFNRKGQTGTQAGAVYAFFNAAMQGTARLGEALMTMEPGKPSTIRLSPFGKKVVYGGMLMGSMQAMALAAAGFGEDEPPDFVRERSFIIPTGGKGYINIPMPLGLHVIPNVGRITTEFALSGFSKPHQRLAELVGLFADAFNPIGNAGLSMQTLAPTALDPLVALTENKDWTGKPIARTSFNKDVPGFTQHKDSATWISKFLAESINTLSGGNKYVAGVLSPTPDQIDYLGGQLGGGVFREASKVEQTVTNLVTGEATPSHKIPLLGRFYGSAAGQAGESNAFYANTAKLNKLETEIKGLEKDGKREEAAALRRRPEAFLIAQANTAERQIQKLRKEKSELVKAGAPREQVKQVEERITQAMARLNRSIENRKAQ